MMSFFSEWKGFLAARTETLNVSRALMLLLLSIIVQVTLGRYSADQAVSAGPASDIFLNNSAGRESGLHHRGRGDRACGWSHHCSCSAARGILFSA
jgi:hypothetical protein